MSCGTCKWFKVESPQKSDYGDCFCPLPDSIKDPDSPQKKRHIMRESDGRECMAWID